jgi:hypothetical protein
MVLEILFEIKTIVEANIVRAHTECQYVKLAAFDQVIIYAIGNAKRLHIQPLL